jgi:hypothetical protein
MNNKQTSKQHRKKANKNKAKQRNNISFQDMSITCQGCKDYGRGTVILITGMPNNDVMENQYIPFIRGLSKYISTFTAEGSNVRIVCIEICQILTQLQQLKLSDWMSRAANLEAKGFISQL